MLTRFLLFLGLLLGASCGSQGDDGDRFLFLTRPGKGTTGSAKETQDYYDGMDPRPEATLPDWARNRCIDITQSGNAAAAFYYNGSDLGLGREMRCAECTCAACLNLFSGKSKDPTKIISCVVSNHGFPQGLDLVKHNVKRDDSIKAALEAVEKDLSDPNNLQRAASVAMDYMPDRVDKVRFYIYDGNIKTLFQKDNVDKKDFVLIRGLQLDSEGDKFIRNCLSCHGGRYDDTPGSPTQDKILGSSFLDFDISLFCFGDDQQCLGFKRAAKVGTVALTRRGTAGVPSGNLDNLRKFNALVLKIVQDTGAKAIADRISGSYIGSVGDSAAKYDDKQDYVPAAWKQGKQVARLGTQTFSDEQFFKIVVHKYCATCHFSQNKDHNVTQKNGSNPLSFDTPSQWFQVNNTIIDPAVDPSSIFELIKHRVCGASDMPQSEVTSLNLKADTQAFNLTCNSEAL